MVSKSLGVKNRTYISTMEKIVILGRGGAGKSTFARRLGKTLGIQVIELDKHFWQPGLVATPKDKWVQIQNDLAANKNWIMDGDLGEYDVLDVRLGVADTVLLLDFPFFICAWRAFRRGKERLDFWLWLLSWRKFELPKIERAISHSAGKAMVYRFCRQKDLERFLENPRNFAPVKP
jgi:adenylate kinase family enzyme